MALRFLKGILNFFLSLRTAIWLLLGLLCFLFYGSFVMPLAPEFQSINSQPLFMWLRQHPASATWWLAASIAALSLLTANTMLCSIESIIKKREKRHWLIIMAPQIIHIGFLFILLAHFLSSMGSSRGNIAAYEGSLFMLPNGIELKINTISAALGSEGYPMDWRTDVEYFKEGVRLKQDSLGPNKPSFYKGLGIYQKNMQIYPFKAVLLEISKEPGAAWALIGGVLFIFGTAALISMKIMKEK